jgi:hypothetical protein
MTRASYFSFKYIGHVFLALCIDKKKKIDAPSGFR